MLVLAPTVCIYTCIIRIAHARCSFWYVSVATIAAPPVPNPLSPPTVDSGLGFPAGWLLTPNNLRAVVDKHVSALASTKPSSGTAKVPDGAVAVMKHLVSLMPKQLSAKGHDVETISGFLQ